jgi:hypothetical protein
MHADIGIGSEVPVGDICSAANCTLVDHLVGEGEQIVRYVDTERLRRLQDGHFCRI